MQYIQVLCDFCEVMQDVEVEMSGDREDMLAFPEEVCPSCGMEWSPEQLERIRESACDQVMSDAPDSQFDTYEEWLDFHEPPLKE